MAISEAFERKKIEVAALPCWSGPVDPEPLSGGLTNMNFLVVDAGRTYVARVGDDIPVHHILRWNERAASEAAHAAGISPRVVFRAPGVMVTDFIRGKTLGADDVRDRAVLSRIVPVLQKCHRDIPKHIRGPSLIFWVFHVVRDYAHALREHKSRMAPELPRLLEAAAELERAASPIDVVYGHNDLLPANLIDDGQAIWLIDWDYAGFGSPLFDLGGLASNCSFSPADERFLLEAYFERPPSDELNRRYAAMKCASLLRESMWSMVSEVSSSLDFDYVAYTNENLARFERALQAFQEM